MENLRKYTCGHPVISAFILLIIALAVQNLLSYIITFSTSLVTALISELAITIIALYYIYLINGTGEFKLDFNGFGYALKLTWLPLLTNLALAIGGIINNINNGGTIVDNAFLILIELTVYTLSIGIFEESMFRGVFLNAFLAKNGDSFKGLLKACALSSLMFGIVHIYGDIIFAVLDPSKFTMSFVIEVIGKIVQTGLFGFVLCVLVLRTHNLWIAAFIHFLNDFPITISTYVFNTGSIGNYTSLSNDVMQSIMIYSMYIVVQLPLAIYAYFQLKKVPLPQWGMNKVCWYPIKVRKTKKI